MRILAFMLLALVAFYTPLWSFALFALCYALVWHPYELLILALLIDAEFGSASSFGYWYLATTGGLLLLSLILKPYLRFYQNA